MENLVESGCRMITYSGRSARLVDSLSPALLSDPVLVEQGQFCSGSKGDDLTDSSIFSNRGLKKPDYLGTGRCKLPATRRGLCARSWVPSAGGKNKVLNLTGRGHVMVVNCDFRVVFRDYFFLVDLLRHAPSLSSFLPCHRSSSHTWGDSTFQPPPSWMFYVVSAYFHSISLVV